MEVDETTSEQTTETNIIEVDQITEAVDANDAIMDEAGNVVQYLDREKNITYKVKGKENPLAPEKENNSDSLKQDASKTGETSDSGKNKPIDAKKDAQPKGDEKTNQYRNDAEYVLRKTGYDKDEIDLGEGIGKVKIADLTPEQQIQVIVSEFDETIAEYQEAIKDLEARKPELKFDNPQAQQILDYLKEGGDIKKLAKEILSRDPAAQAKMLSDDEIVKLGIKKEFPEFTEEEINAEFQDMEKAGSISRRAKALRNRMEKEQPDFSSLTKEQREAKDAQIQIEREQFDKEVANVKDTAKKLGKIGGFPITEQIAEYLTSKVIPKTMQEDSVFVQKLNNPEKLLTLEFWDTYGETIIKKTAEYYFKKGQESSGPKGDDSLSDDPIRTYQSRSSKKGSSKKSIDDFENFEQFVSAANF
jgi:hypothetical protein